MPSATLDLPHVAAGATRRAPRRFDPFDPRVLDLLHGTVPEPIPAPLGDDPRVQANARARPIGLLGVPFDHSIPGRKGAREGPAAIREACRYFAAYDATTDLPLTGLRMEDHGDVTVAAEDTRTTHERVEAAVAALVDAGRIPFLLGGDHSLTYPHVAGLASRVEGRIGIVVIDAHYDLRPVRDDGHISSGTPFWRLLNELPPGPQGARVQGTNLIEIGLRPFANSDGLRQIAEAAGVRVVTAARAEGMPREQLHAEIEAALEGVDQVWLSIDIDGLDQSHAPGCSAPTPGGLSVQTVLDVCRTVAHDARFAGMDLLEVAPGLDPTGNTARVAAACLVHALGGMAERAQCD